MIIQAKNEKKNKKLVKQLNYYDRHVRQTPTELRLKAIFNVSHILLTDNHVTRRDIIQSAVVIITPIKYFYADEWTIYETAQPNLTTYSFGAPVICHEYII